MLKKRKRTSTGTSAALEALNDTIIDAIQDIKGVDIVKLDLRQVHDASVDFFIICQGNSHTQIAGIADNIEKKVAEVLGIQPNHAEGKKNQHWMLVDYFLVVVHIFSKEKRAFYNLEGLWGDAKVTRYENLS